MIHIRHVLALLLCLPVAIPLHGAATVLDLSEPRHDVVLHAANAQEGLGEALLIADLNGDGHRDLVVGAPGSDVGDLSSAGRVRVFFGPLRSVTEVDLRTDPADAEILGLHWAGYLGSSLAAGDLDGDGWVDLAIGAWGTEASTGDVSAHGAVYVVSGPILPGVSRDLSATPAAVEVRGANAGDHLGRVVHIADLTADGQPDLVLGVPAADGPDRGRVDAGEIHVLHGPLARGTVQDLAELPGDSVVLGDRAMRSITEPGDQLGWTLAIADLDLDGQLDLACGISNGDGPADACEDCGELHVLLGPFASGDVRDLREEGSDIVVWGARPATGTIVGERLGRELVVADLFATGEAQIVVSVLEADGAGSVLVLEGPFPAGLRRDLSVEPEALRLTDSDSRQAANRSSIASGDVDGDGLADLFVGAHRSAGPDGSRSQAGQAFLLLGPLVERGRVELDESLADVTLLGADGSDRAGSALALGELSGDRKADVVVAASGADGADETLPRGGEVRVLFGRPGARPPSCDMLLPGTWDCEELSDCAGGWILPLDGSASDDRDGDLVQHAWLVDCGRGESSAFGELSEACAMAACGDDCLVSLVVADALGNEAECLAQARVVDTRAPVLTGPSDLRVRCDEVPPAGSVIAEDGCDENPVVEYHESEEPGDCPGNRTLVRTWTATDSCGNEGRHVQRVELWDEVAPVLSRDAVESTVLWPPRHDTWTFHLANFSFSVREACSEPIELRLVACTSDQPIDGLGDGRTAPDCRVSSNGLSVSVRAERAGGLAQGRTYSVMAQATDSCGNTSPPTEVGLLHVPHDRRRGGR